MVKQIKPAGLLICFLLLLSVRAAAQTDSAMIAPSGANSSIPTPSAGRKSFEVGVHFSTLRYSDYGDNVTEPGFGGRFGYNFNDNVAAEAEVSFYPRAHKEDPTVSGRKTLALFGVKAGARLGKFGFYGKARPGFIFLNRRLSIACVAVVVGNCILKKTNFAFDLGGVVEYYLSPRTLLRFDLGDTIIRSSIIGGYDVTHNLQINAGVGFRF